MFSELRQNILLICNSPNHQKKVTGAKIFHEDRPRILAYTAMTHHNVTNTVSYNTISLVINNVYLI